MIRNLMVMFAAGTFGALCNFLFGVVMAKTGAFDALGVKLPPPDMPGALYSRLVWGGIWGAILLLPLPKTSIVWHGLILGILPSLAAGFYFFPQKGLGMFGINAGQMMPLIIFAFNWVWGSSMLWIYKQA